MRPLIRNFLSSFSPSSFSSLARPGYVWELRTALFFPLALACVEGGVIGVIARKSFDASDLVVTTLSAAPSIANVFSFYWAGALRSRDRVRVVSLAQSSLILCVLAIALCPVNTLGIALLLAFTLAARFFATGIFAARTDIWRGNYARSERGRATGNIAVLVSVTVSAASLLIGAGMDAAGDRALLVFRALFIALGLAAFLGVWCFSHLRWRGRASTISAESDANATEEERSASPMAMLAVLKRDPTYRRFMSAQMVMGAPNLAVLAPFIIAIDTEMSLSYTPSVILTQVLPLAAPILAIPLWARLLDRVHIVRFRVYHSWVFVAANALTGVGLLLHSFWLLFLARAVLGFGMAGGQLAWNLGHHDFAPKHLARLYMGVHVMLTGIRGVFAPYIGTLLYAGGAVTVGATVLRFPALGAYAFFVLAAISVAGAIQFYRLDLDIRRGVLKPRANEELDK